MIFFALVLIVLASVWIYWETIKLQAMVFLIVSRGIISPNRFWWNVSETLLRDASGVEFYRQLKERHGQEVLSLNMMGEPMHIVMHEPYVKKILDGSPCPYGVGKFKYNFFKSFMSKNVGVSEGQEWVQRRKLNERVLDSEITYSVHFDHVPTHFDDFNHIGQKIAMKIVFGDTQIHPEVFQIFSDANSVSAIFGYANLKTKPEYEKYLKENIMDPVPGSYTAIASSLSKDVDDIMHQIPHWIFPTVGLFNTTLPRLILFLHHHPRIKEKLDRFEDGYFLRACILETLRLNNPVVTTFRTSLYPVELDKKYPTGTSFLILNNPILRESFFEHPDRFVPERWTPELEKSYYAISFNQGPQKCPGKEVAIKLISLGYREFVRVCPSPKNVDPQIDTEKIPQMINPYSIKIFT